MAVQLLHAHPQYSHQLLAADLQILLCLTLLCLAALSPALHPFLRAGLPCVTFLDVQHSEEGLCAFCSRALLVLMEIAFLTDLQTIILHECYANLQNQVDLLCITSQTDTSTCCDDHQQVRLSGQLTSQTHATGASLLKQMMACLDTGPAGLLQQGILHIAHAEIRDILQGDFEHV